jgi:hypothetical protein
MKNLAVRSGTWAFSLLVLAASLSFGCSSEPEGEPAKPTLTRSASCVKSLCEAERDDCSADRDECEDTCLSGSLDFFEACYDVCRDIQCGATCPEVRVSRHRDRQDRTMVIAKIGAS